MCLFLSRSRGSRRLSFPTSAGTITFLTYRSSGHKTAVSPSPHGQVFCMACRPPVSIFRGAPLSSETPEEARTCPTSGNVLLEGKGREDLLPVRDVRRYPRGSYYNEISRFCGASVPVKGKIGKETCFTTT